MQINLYNGYTKSIIACLVGSSIDGKPVTGFVLVDRNLWAPDTYFDRYVVWNVTYDDRNDNWIADTGSYCAEIESALKIYTARIKRSVDSSIYA